MPLRVPRPAATTCAQTPLNLLPLFAHELALLLCSNTTAPLNLGKPPVHQHRILRTAPPPPEAAALLTCAARARAARLDSASWATSAAVASGASPRRCAESTTPATSSGNTLSQTPSVAASTTSPAATATVLSCAAAAQTPYLSHCCIFLLFPLTSSALNSMASLSASRAAWRHAGAQCGELPGSLPAAMRHTQREHRQGPAQAGACANLHTRRAAWPAGGHASTGREWLSGKAPTAAQDSARHRAPAEPEGGAPAGAAPPRTRACPSASRASPAGRAS